MKLNKVTLIKSVLISLLLLVVFGVTALVFPMKGYGRPLCLKELIDGWYIDVFILLVSIVYSYVKIEESNEKQEK